LSEQLAISGGTPVLPEMPPAFEPMSADEVAAAAATLRDVPLTTLFGGHEIERFENEYAEFCGARFGVAVNSGTSALNAALLAAGVGPGDEVITTPLSFVASASTIVQAGARPVFADVEPDTYCLDPAAAAELVTPATKAILPVHINGYPADVPALNELAARHGLAVVEDAAQAHGARVGGRHVGTLGDYGCFSFNIGKILRTGEGGMVLTDDPAAADRLRAIRVNGMAPGPAGSVVVALGANYTMPQAMASIGRRQLARHPEALVERAHNAKLLLDAVDQVDGLTPLPDTAGRERVAYFPQLVLSDELAPLRDRLVAALRAENVPAAICRPPLYHVPYLREICPDAWCPVAERQTARTLSVDVMPCYTPAQMDGIAAGLRKVFANVSRLAD
jgi:dTDP-4-amino-4,6-dideoxygalactose transaminase